MRKKELQIMIFEDIKKLVEHKEKEKEKCSVSGIASKFHIDRKTARRYLKLIKENKDLSHNYQSIATATNEIEKYRDIILGKLSFGTKVIYIFDFLKQQYDVKFSYQSLTRWVRKHNEHEEHLKSKEIKIIYERYPGKQAQVDWKENFTLYNRSNRKIVFNVFLIKLSFSRKVALFLTFDKKQDTVIKCLLKSFEKFGGVPEQIVFDNMKTVVYEPNSANRKDYVINEKFNQFAKDCKFDIYTCKAHRPETKGKVESLAKCIDELSVYNHEFNDEEELSRIVEQLENKINNRISTATGFAPNVLFYRYEMEELNNNKINPLIFNYYMHQEVERKVSKMGFISYENNMYSVPIEYVGMVVNVKIKNSFLNIYYNQQLISTHEMCDKLSKNKKILKEEHLIQLYKKQNLFNDDTNKLMNAVKETLDVLKLFNK